MQYVTRSEEAGSKQVTRSQSRGGTATFGKVIGSRSHRMHVHGFHAHCTCMSPTEPTEYDFLFSPPDSIHPSATRKIYIRRLYDVLQLCIHRNDFARARRAWAILARCKEIDWKTLWKIGLHLLGNHSDDDVESNEEKIRFLKTIMRQYSEDEVSTICRLM